MRNTGPATAAASVRRVLPTLPGRSWPPVTRPGGRRWENDPFRDVRSVRGQRRRHPYTHKRNLFLKGLEDIGIPHTDPQGAYYILLDISEFGFDSDLEFCEVLARDVGVGAVPGSSFFREPVNHLIRLHFAKKDETLNEALNRLQDMRKKIPVRK